MGNYLTPQQRQELISFRDKVQKTYIGAELIIFGSAAFGRRLYAFSDIDVAVVSNQFSGQPWAARQVALRALCGPASPISPIGVTPAERSRQADCYPTIIRAIQGTAGLGLDNLLGEPGFPPSPPRKPNFRTVQHRSIRMARSGETVRAATIELPPGMAPEGPYTADAALAEVVEFAFGVRAGHVMTFDRWHNTRNRIASIVAAKRFREEMSSTIGGSQEGIRAFLTSLDELETILARVRARVETPADYTTCVLRNLVLNRAARVSSRFGPLLESSGYTDARGLAQSLYADLPAEDPTTLRLWSMVASATLNEGVLPTIKDDFENLLSMELPFSGTPTVSGMTLEAAMLSCRGCGIYTLAHTAMAASGALSHGLVAAMAITGTGGAISILFIGFGCVLPWLEDALDRGLHRNRGSKPKDS